MLCLTPGVYISVILQLPYTSCLECYSCTDVTMMVDCKSVTQCPAGSLCPLTNTSTSTLVGRSLSARTNAECSACCSRSNCNRQLCQPDNPTCSNSGAIDCDDVGSYVNFCSITDHAKMVCKKFCGLCNMVDGGWSAWISWLPCSVSCGNGTQTRTRSCSDPYPASGGSDCTGVSHETRACSKDSCPVNGGWSNWSPWGSCSVSCGIGLQRRDRACNNPYPSNSGIHCFGDARDDRICPTVACQDGGWTEWSGWNTCSSTCGTGVQTSSRSCTNPTPSVLGKACTGDNVKVRTCSGVGCVDTRIGFTVGGISRLGTNYNNAILSHVYTNQGGGYDTSSGVFTCSVPGMYVFRLDITKANSTTAATCWIYRNNHLLVSAWVSQTSNGDYLPASTAIYVHLVAGDRVHVGDCSALSTFHSDARVSLFTGYLVDADYH